MNASDTIYAVSSGRGRAGIAVVRLSGTACLDVVKKLSGVNPAPRQAQLVTLRDPVTQDVIDKCVVLFFQSPATVTGEDVAEFHIHGSPAIVQKLFSVFGEFASLRPAEAGEFTRRAFAHGKLDLVEVEGLADLLSADSEPQRKLAMRQFLGEASAVYEAWRLKLVACIAMIEAVIDFSDEDGVADAALVKVRPLIEGLYGDLEKALALSDSVRAVRNGVRVVIGGPPNAGKSTLLNLLAKRDAAIVSPEAGTTRDVIEAVTLISGVPVTLIDTAGVRQTAVDSVEVQGIARAHSQFETADILVWMVASDAMGTYPSGPTGPSGPLGTPEKTPDLILFNKLDLDAETLIQVRNDSNGVEVAGVSLKTGESVGAFEALLQRLITERFASVDDAVIVRARHADRVRDAARILKVILGSDFQSDSHRGFELMADDMRRAARALASVTGRVDVEDFLGHIFGEFCIGK